MAIQTFSEISSENIPRHVGIIMDGNGRWAKQHSMARTKGHQEGLKAAKRIVKAASEIGIKYLTLYTFSTENWKRAASEVNFIMSLIKKHLRSEMDFYRKNHLRIRSAGSLSGLPADIAAEFTSAEKDTKNFTGMNVILAVNYGGRDEIVRALQRYAVAGKDSASVTENEISSYLDNPDVPDPDLIIRSAGEYRLSNFLLWEAAYSEFFISDKLWPDWTKTDIMQAIKEFQRRERRFGGVST